MESSEKPGRQDGSDDEPSAVDAVSEQAQGDLEKLDEGPRFEILGATLPIRGLVAMGVFIVAFMIAWMLLWAALGGLGLALGWIVAAVVAAGVVKLYADRVA